MHSKQAPFSFPVASAISNVAIPAALKQGGDPIFSTQAALLEYALALFASAEQAIVAASPKAGSGSAQVVAAWPNANTLGANEAWALRVGTLDGVNVDADVTQGVPAEQAVALHYLATRRAVRKLVRASEKAPDGAVAIVNHEAVSIGGEGGPTVNVPGVGTILIPGIPGALSGVDDDLGVIPAAVVVLCLGVAAIAAGAWVADSVLEEREVQATRRREIEVAAQVKVATDMCAANAAVGKPCDVPGVVASMAKSEQLESWLVPVGLAAGAVALVGGGLYAAHRKGYL